MKLVVILSRFPFPLEKGDKLRAYHQLKWLSKDHEIILCCLSDQKVKEDWKVEIRSLCSELHVFELNKFTVYFNTTIRLFSSQPYQVGYFYSGWISKKIDKLIHQSKPDHIYCQLIRTAEYAKHHHAIPKTLDYMDALGKGMLRRALISKGIKKRLFRTEGQRLSQYENRIFDYFNHHTIISEQDKKFINHPENERIEVIENGIDTTFFTSRKKEKEFELIFTGNMNYPPNIECALFIVNEILPIIHKTNSHVRLLLSGANPNSKIKELEKYKGVKVTGWVDDIRDSYEKGKIFVAPLFIGTGLQNKLLEAMAMELPCITSKLANNALNAVENETILIAESASDFAEKILDLLNKEEKYRNIAEKGRKFVQEEFSWEKSVQKLENLINS